MLMVFILQIPGLSRMRQGLTSSPMMKCLKWPTWELGLQPRAVEFAKMHDVKICIRSTFTDGRVNSHGYTEYGTGVCW